MYKKLLEEKLLQLKQEGHYRYFLEVNKSVQHFPHFYYTNVQGEQRAAVNWCSNDYLCMSTHEAVIGKLSHTTYKSGTGSGGTRNISGTTIYHRELEATLSAWHGKEAALLFNGAYQANVTTLQTLARNINDLVFFSDQENHASIIEGMRGCKNKKFVFRHNDMAHLRDCLQSVPYHQPKIIVFESVYSMSGSIAPVQEIVQLAAEFNAMTYVDEVHAVGLYGKNGAGIFEREQLQEKIDILNGTLSKAIGVFGGYITASKTIIDFVRSFGNGFIFTTSLPPAICSAARKSIELIQAGDRQVLPQKVEQLRTALRQAGVEYRENPSHITIVPVPGAEHCRSVASRLLLEQGVYLQPINFPTVPRGEECLRIIITGRHQLKHIHHLAHSLKKIIHGDHQADRQGIQALAFADGAGETEN
ncbi:MAG: 5-aminolevulinate synthase [Terrimonas sp.]|nr:5-aminolevulinate synthase [Terrimonas sp.]